MRGRGRSPHPHLSLHGYCYYCCIKEAGADQGGDFYARRVAKPQRQESQSTSDWGWCATTTTLLYVLRRTTTIITTPIAAASMRRVRIRMGMDRKTNERTRTGELPKYTAPILSSFTAPEKRSQGKSRGAPRQRASECLDVRGAWRFRDAGGRTLPAPPPPAAVAPLHRPRTHTLHTPGTHSHTKGHGMRIRQSQRQVACCGNVAGHGDQRGRGRSLVQRRPEWHDDQRDVGQRCGGGGAPRTPTSRFTACKRW